MHEREIEQYGVYQIATAKSFVSKDSWWAWARIGKIEAFDPLKEPGAAIWYEFGSSRIEAAEKIRRKLGLNYG